jgi:hypothetical protein
MEKKSLNNSLKAVDFFCSGGGMSSGICKMLGSKY